MKPVTLLRLIDSGTAPPILDVRTAAEFRRGHVPGAVNIPFQSVAGRLHQVPGAAGRDTLIVYCGHGPRAYLASVALRWWAGRRVQYLQGHWSQWRKSGLPIEQ
jgi:rhodanese-related sulfurtransferase